VSLLTERSFGVLSDSDGLVNASAVIGVDADLVVKPFSRRGMMRSVQEFSVNAFNQHHA
jgi:hypothetical protein